MTRSGRHASTRRALVRLAGVATLRRLAGAAGLGTAALAAGCGFQMRGTTKLPVRTLHASFPAGSPTGAEFRRLLRASGDTELVDRPELAEARLDVLSEIREKEIIGFSSTGRPREYQLRLKFAFRVVDAKGDDRIPYTELVLRRDITTTDTQLVAKEQEEVLLYRDMQSDAVQQLMRRLAAMPR